MFLLELIVVILFMSSLTAFMITEISFLFSITCYTLVTFFLFYLLKIIVLISKPKGLFEDFSSIHSVCYDVFGRELSKTYFITNFFEDYILDYYFKKLKDKSFFWKFQIGIDEDIVVECFNDYAKKNKAIYGYNSLELRNKASNRSCSNYRYNTASYGDFYLDGVELFEYELYDMFENCFNNQLKMPDIYNQYFNEIVLYKRSLSFANYLKMYSKKDYDFLVEFLNNKKAAEAMFHGTTIYYVAGSSNVKVRSYICAKTRINRKFQLDDTEYGVIEYSYDGVELSSSLETLKGGKFLTKDELSQFRKVQEINTLKNGYGEINKESLIDEPPEIFEDDEYCVYI